MRINQDDDNIDYKYYVKNLLKKKGLIKVWGILLFWIIENCDYLKMKQNNQS